MAGLLLDRLELSHESGEALTRQLTNQLRVLITGGRLRTGQSLPSSRALARSLNVSRNTVSFAIEQLTAEGYLSTSQGRRPVVVAGASLVSSRAPSRRAENRGIPGLVSRWARDLHRTDWPPIYRARPRAFQPGLADEREFPHDTWGRCLRRAARNALLRPDRSHNHPALQEALLQHLAEHRGIKAMPRQIIVMPSAQAGIALIASVDRKPRIWRCFRRITCRRRSGRGRAS